MVKYRKLSNKRPLSNKRLVPNTRPLEVQSLYYTLTFSERPLFNRAPPSPTKNCLNHRRGQQCQEVGSDDG